MRDLFPEAGLERLPIPEAEMLLLRNLPLDIAYDDALKRLIAETPWKAEKITVWGKTYLQPRLVSWYGEAGLTYSYSGMTLSPEPWTPLILHIKERIESAIESTFNSVLLNYYRDNRDSMGMHSDDESELGEQPVIGSVSLGEERIFNLKHKFRKDLKPVKLVLPSGSLLVMKGDSQHNWKHGIRKESKLCGPRVNLTFRRIITFKSA